MTANYLPTISQEQLFTVLATWLVLVTSLPQTAVRQGDQNRAALPPPTPGGILMTIIKSNPLNTTTETNTSADADPTQTITERHFEVTVQLDFYSGPTVGNSSGTAFDWVHMVENLWKNNNAYAALVPTCSPLYTNPKVMAPLDDSESQYEQRWIMEVVLQYNPQVYTPEQYTSVLGPVDTVLATVGGGFAPAYPP